MEAPPVISATRPRSLWWLGIAAMLIVAGTILFLFNPSQNSFYPRCTLYVTTGLYCPGCGSLRALHQLAHGHVLAALRYNVLLVASLPSLAFYSLRYTMFSLAGKPAPSFSIRPKWLIFFGAVLILFTILRNIPLAPFNWLAPP